MAKRKRLTPVRSDVVTTQPAAASVGETTGAPPIAHVAGDAAFSAAFDEVQAELKAAQREGRMVLRLPLEAVQEDYLIRDRLVCGSEELAALKKSLRTRGQQTPIEVTELGQGSYGLISGWRRLRALRDLQADSGDLARYGHIQALLRQPEDRSAAYVAMVEENEVRADLSFYERARIVVQAVEAEVFSSDKQALQSLFCSVSFSKRSKVKSFMPLVRAFDGVLRYPAQIPERLGLALSKAILDPAVRAHLEEALQVEGELSEEQERTLLEQTLKSTRRHVSQRGAAPSRSGEVPLTSGICLHVEAGRVELAGAGVTPELISRLKEWLQSINA